MSLPSALSTNWLRIPALPPILLSLPLSAHPLLLFPLACPSRRWLRMIRDAQSRRRQRLPRLRVSLNSRAPIFVSQKISAPSIVSLCYSAPDIVSLDVARRYPRASPMCAEFVSLRFVRRSSRASTAARLVNVCEAVRQRFSKLSSMHLPRTLAKA